jgi:phosphoribosylformylglycinamidine synthase
LLDILARHGLDKTALKIGAPVKDLRVRIGVGDTVLDEAWVDLRRAWSETSWRMRRLRDDPRSADEEYEAQSSAEDPGLSVKLAFNPEEDIAAPFVARGVRPAVAILREQGVNSQVETAAVFERAGFVAHDIHMTDLLAGRRSLREFKGVVACGGFSYGDVLGAGEGWAKSILFHEDVRGEFQSFFERPDTFAFGICNGCQMFAALKSLIPGTAHSSTSRALRWSRSSTRPLCCCRAWPAQSYPSRLPMVRVTRSSRLRQPRWSVPPVAWWDIVICETICELPTRIHITRAARPTELQL